MYKYRRNANFHLSCFIRQRYWPLVIPSIAILFLTFCPQVSQSIQINNNENPDRTVAKRGARDLQLTTTLSPLPLSIPVSPSDSNLEDSTGHILYVISLDGKITAIDAQDNGHQLWTADTGAPLVDSSLSKIEISRDSRSVRLIPSLIGGLFEKYDEDGHVEPLPFDADALLDASFKLHDELVITGGKHIDTLGLDLHTGQVLYSFSKDDTKQQNTLDNNRTTTTADNDEHRATIIVKRTTQTVRARSARSGYEKWNFSVSNHHLIQLRTQSASVVLGQADDYIEGDTTFSGYFEYQLQTGVVLAFDESGRPVWSTAINSPIAAVWELKNGELNEKSLFESTSTPLSKERLDEDDSVSPSAPSSRRLAFIGEFNSTPYVLVSPSVQKQLIYDARKNNVAGSIGMKRPVLSSWHKAYQKRTLSIDSELPENNNPRQSGGSSSESHYPLALRPDPNANPHSHLSSLVETCDTAGYLELINNSNENFIEEASTKHLIERGSVYIPLNTITISTVVLGALLIFYYFKQHKKPEYFPLKSITTDSNVSTTITPPVTPDYHQLEQSFTPPFQSRYTLEYEHVRFLGRGGFGVVFEAINKLDERRVAIKRVSLKKASGKERALKEIRYLAVLNHPNLIQYYYAWNESPPVGWQEEEDKILLVRNNANPRDSISTFPTSANDSESINQGRSSRVSSIAAVQPLENSPRPLFEITFDRSSNPLLINEDFSANSINKNDKSETSSSSSIDQQIDANNNTKSTTKSSVSSSSPFFDHSSSDSSESSDEKQPLKKEHTESDDGIVFLPDDKPSSTSSLIPSQTKSLTEKKKSLVNEKDIPPTYFYFVMELCQPESLRDRLTQRSIDRQQAWSIFDQIIKGIEYIHSQKLIHRDLKPSNILFSMDNTVKIGDFGLVSAFGEDKAAKKKKRDDEKFDPIETITSSTTDVYGNNELGGTMLYMSPEQINREPYNQKVDIYAIGIILFELLYPFSTQMERMQAIANVRLQTPVFPKDFEFDGNNRTQLISRLISWLLSHSPRDRPRASDLRQDTFYQRMLQVEVPHLAYSDARQQSQTMVSGPDQAPIRCSRTRIASSSPFRRTVSSSALHSHRESDSGDIE